MGWTIRGSNHGWGRRFISFPKCSDRIWGPASLPFSGTGVLSPGRALEHWPLSSAEVKNKWSCTSTFPCMCSFLDRDCLNVRALDCAVAVVARKKKLFNTLARFKIRSSTRAFSVLLPFEINWHFTLFSDASNFFIKAWELEVVIRRKKMRKAVWFVAWAEGRISPGYRT